MVSSAGFPVSAPVCPKVPAWAWGEVGPDLTTGLRIWTSGVSLCDFCVRRHTIIACLAKALRITKNVHLRVDIIAHNYYVVNSNFSYLNISQYLDKRVEHFLNNFP